MADSLLCFRTITRAGIFRQVTVSGVTSLVPISIAIPPQSVTISPGDDVEEVIQKACDGRDVIAFTYPKGAKPELQMDFGLATLDLEGITHGRVVATSSNVSGYVFAEFVPTTTSVTPRASGQVGYSVVAQAAATSKAYAYYISPTTKLAVTVAIVDVGSTPTGDQMSIDTHLAITVSDALVTAGLQIYLWCPAIFPAGTILTSTALGLFSVFMQGINFNGTARMLSARNCSRLPGGSAGSDPKQQVKMRILPDPGDGTGLGYTIIDTNLANVC
jgi:hypothetical protein